MFVRLVRKLLLFLMFCFLLFIICRLAKEEKQDQKETKTKTHKHSKIFRKNLVAVKWISSKRTKVYCRCTCHRHTLVFGIQKAWRPPIGAREIDGLPKASMAELLELSRTRIHVIGSGKSPTNLVAMPLNY